MQPIVGIIGMLIIIFHMKMNGKIAYGGSSYVGNMHIMPYFCKNIANMQAGCIPVRYRKNKVFYKALLAIRKQQKIFRLIN